MVDTFNNFFRNVNYSSRYFQGKVGITLEEKGGFFSSRLQTFSYHFEEPSTKTKNPEQARSYAHAYKRRGKRRKGRREKRKRRKEKKRKETKRKERAACGATSAVWIRR